MFKGFQNKSRQFNGFPNLNFQVNNEAYGFSGCTFWLDASYGLNTQTDGQNITTWIDKNSNIVFRQNTAANQPFFRSSDISYNNLPVIDFSTSRFLISDYLGVTIGNNMTLAFIANYDSLGRSPYLLGRNTASSFGGVLLGGSDAGFTGIGFRNTAASLWMSTIENSNVHIVVIKKTEIVVDGVSVLSNASNNIFPELLLNIVGSGVAANSASMLNGKIAEILKYEKEFNSEEMIYLSNILNTKYAIY